MGYRASKQASTKQSPYYMLYQQCMCLPIDVEIMPTSEHGEEVDQDTVVKNLLESRQKAFKKAETNISKAQKQPKDTYDRKHLQDEIPEGSEVLVENTAQKQCKGGKLEDLWLGPYTIHRHLGKGIYELANDKGKILKKKVNVNRLKSFTRRQPETILTLNPHYPRSAPSKKKKKKDVLWKLVLTLNPHHPRSVPLVHLVYHL